MYKALVRTPLQQALMLLWVLGLMRLGTWLTHAQPTWKWILSATIGTLLLLLIGARLRVLVVVPICIALGLATLLVAGHWLGAAGITSVSSTVTAVYGLAVWAAAVRLLAWPAMLRIADLLGWRGGYSGPGGRYSAERYVYWSSFACICGSLSMAASYNSAPAAIPAAPWTVLAASLVFLLHSGQHYGVVLNTYLSIILIVWSILSAAAFVGLGTDAAVLPVQSKVIGLTLAISSAMAWVAGRLIGFDAERATTRLYALPLRNASVGMALLALLQVLMLAAYDLHTTSAWSVVWILAVSSAVILLVNRNLLQASLGFVGALSAAWALFWLYGSAVHMSPPFGLWPGDIATGEGWLVLAILALGAAVAGYLLYSLPRWRKAFGRPFLVVAMLIYGLSLAGALPLYTAGSPHLPWILAVLIAVLFPLLRPLAAGQELRGVSIALLLSFLVAAALGPAGRVTWGVETTLLWAFALWAIGTLALPRMNAAFPDWVVAPRAWPWLGLAAIGFGIGLASRFGVLSHWGLSVITAVYLLLMLRHSAWPGFSWFAVIALSLGAVLFSTSRYQSGLAIAEHNAVGMLALENLLWVNLLLGFIPFWQRYGEGLAARVGFHAPLLRTPLLYCAFALSSFWLLGLLLWDGMLIVASMDHEDQHILAVYLGGVLSVTLLHGFVHWPGLISAHMFISSLLAIALAAWGVIQLFHLPLVLVLFSILLVAIWTAMRQPDHPPTRIMSTALQGWLVITPFTAFTLLAAVPGISVHEQLITVTLLAALAVYLGSRQQKQLWFYAAALFMVLVLHGIWLLWIPPASAQWLLPVYGLQFALVTWLLRRTALQAREAHAAGAEIFLGFDMVNGLLANLTLAMAVLSVSEWLLHVLSTVQGIAAGFSISDLVAPWGNAAAVATPLVLGTLCVIEVRRSQRDIWVYTAAVLAGVTGVYCRVLWFGLAPVGVWDTAAIIAAAYGLFALRLLTGSRAVLNLTMVLPLVALLTVPLQFGSVHATFSLFAIGALYLLTQRATGMGTPTYLALLAVNGGFYLWVPDWSNRFGLLQGYIVPAALSVLLLLHLHRHELKRGVLNGARLIALSTLYAAATADVFLQESLWVFVLALLLSLTGIALGIVVRTRVFLYTGVAFLIINVAGQLVQLYPEQRLARALLLMGLGAAITAAMIWFNLKRETIMQRIRIIRADLAGWE